MYRKNIAAAAAILFIASSTAIPSYASPVILEEGMELTSNENEVINETETEESQTEEPEAGFTPEAGFVAETESETELELEEETEELELQNQETEPVIESPVVEQTFRFFQVDTVYALCKRDKVSIYEEMDIKSEKTGIIDSYGVLHILSDEMDGWYYVESGKVRGFIKSKYLSTGRKAEKYVEIKSEDCMDTAEMLKEPDENRAFLYTQTTSYDTLAKKRYALAKENIEIVDRIPEEELEEEQESSKIEDNIEETENKENSKESEQKAPVVIGTLEEKGLCYILDDEDEEWIYVESDDVRGFVKADKLKTGSEVRREIREKGENSYKLAEELVKPEDNKACYYTYSSVKEASVSGLIRTSMIKYAEQFLGNPYVWGGTSLTNGADCSGFVQSIYANFGYGIPRVAEDQAYCAEKIPVEDALPGDLIFYERDNYIYHVVMSTGDGGTIEAKGSAYGIVRSTVNYDNAVWAVRIISDEDTDILEHLKKNDMASKYYNTSVIAKPSEYGSLLGNFKLTAYCSCPVCCGLWSGGPTASGVMPEENHTVAMAGVPFGTELIINGQVYTVEDRGTPYGHVDIYMDDHDEALQFGVQYAEVYQKQ